MSYLDPLSNYVENPDVKVSPLDDVPNIIFALTFSKASSYVIPLLSAILLALSSLRRSITLKKSYSLSKSVIAPSSNSTSFNILEISTSY
jgi:hypothetical protein